MSVTREMPRYQSHKQVWGLKIAKIEHLPYPDTWGHSAAGSYGAIITPAEDGYAFQVSAEYMTKHRPEVGGYYVRYEDGYESYSPAGAFEGGYTLITDSPPASNIEQEIQNIGPPDDYRGRVLKEKDSLDEKLSALIEFSNKTEFAALPLHDQELLNTQRHLMCAYSAVLGARIDRFDNALILPTKR